ncbi:hypothetical protein J11TS1_12780 [Oceanobacillus sp. J11TS1]|nr:hypothetical protein J11TS1_12780 [Oceanobacillus sp. J11TS1]
MTSFLVRRNAIDVKSKKGTSVIGYKLLYLISDKDEGIIYKLEAETLHQYLEVNIVRLLQCFVHTKK